MAASRTALPSVVPTTVVSAARVPSRAPVAMTSVTIGPGVTTRTAVITRKAAKSSQFMTIYAPRAVGVIVGKSGRSGMAAELGARRKGNGGSAPKMEGRRGRRDIVALAAVLVS